MNPELRGMHRNPDHDTSVRAAGRVRRFTLREQVREFAFGAGRVGITDGDLKDWQPDRPESSLRKRRTELAQENVLIDSGRTRPNRHGQAEIVWLHRQWADNPPPLQERQPAEPLQARAARLEARVKLMQGLLAEALPYVERSYATGAWGLAARIKRQL